MQRQRVLRHLVPLQDHALYAAFRYSMRQHQLSQLQSIVELRTPITLTLRQLNALHSLSACIWALTWHSIVLRGRQAAQALLAPDLTYERRRLVLTERHTCHEELKALHKAGLAAMLLGQGGNFYRVV